MPGTSRLLRWRVCPSSVLVRVAATFVTTCHLPRTRVIDGVIEVSLVSRSPASSNLFNASSEKRSSAGSPIGMS